MPSHKCLVLLFGLAVLLTSGAGQGTFDAWDYAAGTADTDYTHVLPCGKPGSYAAFGKSSKEFIVIEDNGAAVRTIPVPVDSISVRAGNRPLSEYAIGACLPCVYFAILKFGCVPLNRLAGKVFTR